MLLSSLNLPMHTRVHKPPLTHTLKPSLCASDPYNPKAPHADCEFGASLSFIVSPCDNSNPESTNGVLLLIVAPTAQAS